MKYLGALQLLVCVMYTSADLTEFSWSQDEVSGIYKNEDETLGIRFISRQDFLDISSLNNVTLVHLDSFREVNQRRARSIYILESEYLQHEDHTLDHLDRPVDINTKPFSEVLNDLLDIEEVKLLEAASRAVGDKGVTGRDTTAVLLFHMFALKVTRLIENDDGQAFILRDKRSRVEKAITGCRRYLNYPNCRGLCGRKCSCWWWVCRNCCYNRGCYDHDVCCNKRGFSHYRCLFPHDLQCNKKYTC